MYTINILYICICLIHICVCVCICAQAFIYILTICQFSLQQLFQVTHAHTNNFKYIFIYCIYIYSSLFVFCKRKLCFANIPTYISNKLFALCFFPNYCRCCCALPCSLQARLLLIGIAAFPFLLCESSLIFVVFITIFFCVQFLKF